MPSIDEQRVILIWRPGDARYLRAFVRGIHPDGFFYGEVRSDWPDDRIALTVEGSLSAAENQRLRQHIRQVQTYAEPERLPPGNHVGLIGLGPLHAPTLVLKQPTNSITNPALRPLWHQIVETIEPHLPLNADRTRIVRQ
ncbi:hypothetical protein [Bremerella cremea]|uniref:hypothetical protein n=1 Tax=Bremerella cremea TaxID=1031537 RepID=UPI0031EDEAFB